MSKILFAGYDLEQKNVKNIETKRKNFYYELASVVSKAGNEVLMLDCVWGRNKKIPQQLIDRIKSFSPDLCVLFNYSFWDLSDFISCKIVYCDIDATQDISIQRNYYIRNIIDKCLFVTTEAIEKERIKETFGIDDNQVHIINIPVASGSVEKSSQDKKYDLLYIGTNRICSGYNEYRNFLAKNATSKEIDDAKRVLELISNNYDSSISDEHNNILSYANNRLGANSAKRIREDNCAIKKIRMLSSVSKLGLVIKGTNWNSDVMNYYPEVLECVDSFNQFDIDNYAQECSQSKISLWFDDGQYAKGSYARLLEGAQANTVLIAQKTERSKMVIETLKLPCFTNEKELVALCKKYLSDDAPNYPIASIHKKIRKVFNGQDFISLLQDFAGIEFGASDMQIQKEEELPSKAVCVKSITTNEIILPKNSKSVSPKESSKLPDKCKNHRAKVLIQKIWDKIALYFGYDLRNVFPKKSLKIGKFIVYEKLCYTKTTDRFYVLSLPVLEIRKEKDGAHLHLAAITQIFENAIKFFHYLKSSKKRVARKSNVGIYSILRQKLQTGKKIKICLFVSRISCWIFGDLYSTLIQSGKFDPIVVVKPFMFNGHDAMVDYMNNTYESLKNRGYNVVKGYDETTGEFLDVRNVINPDIVFYTKYWLPQFQENFYINKFEDKLTFYTSYCFDIAYHPECMNFELNNKVDRYFMPTPIHKEMAEVAMTNHAKNVYVVGAPKLDVFFDKTYKPKDVWKPQEKRKKRIIWAPHHSDNFPGNLYQFNAFYELTDFMFEMAEKYKEDIQIAFKPHPMLKPYLVNKKWGKESADAYYEKWANLDNGQLETGEFVDLFLTSDAMILDSISFIAEYTATNKPSLFTIGSTSRVKLNDFGAINFEVLYHTDNNLKADIERFIVDVVINGNDTKKDERTKFVNKYLLPPNGKSAAENIYDNIIDEIYNGDKRKK